MVILPQALSSHQFPYFFPLFPSFSLITHLPQFFQPSELWPRPPFIPLCEWDGHHFYSHSLTYSHISQDPKGSSRIQRIPLELVPDASYGSVVDFFHSHWLSVTGLLQTAYRISSWLFMIPRFKRTPRVGPCVTLNARLVVDLNMRRLGETFLLYPGLTTFNGPWALLVRSAQSTRPNSPTIFLQFLKWFCCFPFQNFQWYWLLLFLIDLELLMQFCLAYHCCENS